MHDSTAHWYFNEDIDVDFPDAKADISVTPDGADWLVTVAAQSLLKDLCLFVDRIHPDAAIDDMLITSLPGQAHTFHVTSPVSLDAAVLGTSPVFRCASQLVE